MSAGWNTVESDAGVFTFLVDNLGVKDVQFEELVALDEDELRQLGTVYGVIFLFKYPTDEARPSASERSEPQDGTYDYAGAESMFFANQVIQNACGTQALLSVLLNKDGEVEVGSVLREFKEFTGAFPPELRGETLSNSTTIRDVHNSFARASPFISDPQQPVSPEDAEDVYHFVAYTSSGGILYELDGLHPAPISHGPCTPADFPAAIVPVLQRRIARYPAGEIRFNLLALVRDRRTQAREVGDSESLRREEQRREAWAWENALRRHNMVGFAAEVLKGVVAAKLKEGAYDGWVEEAVQKTKKRAEDNKARRIKQKEEVAG